MAVNLYVAAGRPEVVKLQAPALLAVAVPSGFDPPSDTVTVEPLAAFPVRVMEPLAFAVYPLMTGAATTTVRPTAAEAALVPAEVVSVAVKP